ncbi:hypothetical protein IEQ34_017054 [Dendrobium chrysotoxum]|uniref:Serine-threonine/tyrosine-protein kinase catalytic domain-containing protein n=1 Tax=Dendrobium chrysotoxum TaxID=161865 RepID=A0AAV7FZC7_DENCH|nr:hypothetical protein IEQ34_017054 [Dendrobium chrysotoxum]
MGQKPYVNIHYETIIDGIVSSTLRPLVLESCDYEWRSLMEKCWLTEPSKRPCFIEIAKKNVNVFSFGIVMWNFLMG